jgi:hypothetical protein
MMSHFRHGIEPEPTRAVATGWLAVVCTAIVILSASPRALAATDLSDTPMFTRVLPPPANIMFLLDDSGSMNFEILVTGQYDGSFPDPAKSATDLANDPHGFCYLFDNVGDNAYNYSAQPDWYAGQEGRKLWQTQFYQTNAMYYNPSVTYTPWPSYGSVTFTNANTDTPRSHPVNGSYTLNLDGTSYTVGTVIIPHSRYVIYSGGIHYLVVLDKASSSKKYYTFTLTGSGLAGRSPRSPWCRLRRPMCSQAAAIPRNGRTSPTGSPTTAAGSSWPRMPWPTSSRAWRKSEWGSMGSTKRSFSPLPT